MIYKQLTAADRGAIEVLLQENYTQESMAEKLGIDPSTVSREIKRGSTPSGYFAKIAQERYLALRKKCRKKKELNYSKRQKYLCEKLELGWSPEQISGRLKLEGSNLYVCKETIYQFLYTDPWARQETLYQYLRYGRKKRKKQTGRSVHRVKIPNRVSIHERPEVVVQKVQYGHSEADSVVYKDKMAINTLNELKTGIVRFTKLDRKTAEKTAATMIKAIRELGLKTCTVDNGSEHVRHEEITKATKANIYFADPYSSWQRGSNENTNMLLRGYLPKKTDITDLTQEELDDIAEELNNRPRKRLDYQTPNEVYYKMLELQKGEKVAVAIRI